MTNATQSDTILLTLPSDQEASGRTLGDEEIALAAEAIRSVRHAWACASGTAAVHTAVAALDPEPGDEIITSPITDMGALAPILYQGAIPVFADVDPDTLNVTAATIRARLSPRTRAIMVTHLF